MPEKRRERERESKQSILGVILSATLEKRERERERESLNQTLEHAPNDLSCLNTLPRGPNVLKLSTMPNESRIPNMRVSVNWGTLFGGTYTKAYSILGPILGSPYGNYHMTFVFSLTERYGAPWIQSLNLLRCATGKGTEDQIIVRHNAVPDRMHGQLMHYLNSLTLVAANGKEHGK